MPTRSDVTQLPLARAADAVGTVVVVDVLRAFTTAAHALDRGAASIRLVAEVDEALALREDGHVDLVLGEVGGHPVEGFDLSNSPAEIAGSDLTGRHLAMRTTAGTRGAVAATGADRLLTGAFVNARATAAALRRDGRITFLLTGESHGRDGDEDRALADYVTALVAAEEPPLEPYLERVRTSDHGRRFGEDLPAVDLELACEVDRFDRALEITRHDGALVISGS